MISREAIEKRFIMHKSFSLFWEKEENCSQEREREKEKAVSPKGELIQRRGQTCIDQKMC